MNTDLLSLFDTDEAKLRAIVAKALAGADDGELFVEHAQAELLTFDNGRLWLIQHRPGFWSAFGRG